MGCNACQDILLHPLHLGRLLVLEYALLCLTVLQWVHQNQDVWLRLAEIVSNTPPDLQPAMDPSGACLVLCPENDRFCPASV